MIWFVTVVFCGFATIACLIEIFRRLIILRTLRRKGRGGKKRKKRFLTPVRKETLKCLVTLLLMAVFVYLTYLSLTKLITPFE